MLRLSLFVILTLFNVSGIVTSNIQPVNLCELHGTVYIEDNPDNANFFLYEEDSEAFADFLIFETDNALFATEPGIWYFTDKKGFEDFSVYFVDSKGSADFTVFFTSFESFAGCNN
jgi:hypothetical protein